MLDNGMSITAVLACGLVLLVTLYHIAMIFVDIYKGKRRFKGHGIRGVITLITSLAVIAGIGYCLYNAPRTLLDGFSWGLIDEMGPSSLLYAVLSLAVVIPVFYVYFILSHFFEKKDEKPFFLIIIMGVASGFGNSIMVFIINEALNRILNADSRQAGIESGLYVYFLLGLILFTSCAVIVRKKLIVLTSNFVYEKRIAVVDRILKSSYQKFEVMEDGKAHAALNNDTEAISGFVDGFVTAITGIISLIVCFIYLGFLNIWAMSFSILIILLAVGMFLKASASAEKMYEKNRDIQNVFFKFINDMIRGFKELYISYPKRMQFKNDMQDSCKSYRDTRIEGEFKFVGVTVAGEIMYMTVIGLVVFLFPIIFSSVQGSTLRSYVFIYLYMGGIVNAEVVLVPMFMRVMISWKRLNGFLKEIESVEEERAEVIPEPIDTLELRNVKFGYKNESGEEFTVGPINGEFKSGELAFITGGNGSGKTTLAKIITGLYKADEGEVLINGKVVDSKDLGNYFSTVYSDFFLFDKLYGIKYENKAEEINKYLKVLRIDDKVHVKDGAFSTLRLSSGQRKRMALLLNYLEERPACFLDEWAADQDPEFRRIFYKELLPQLKEMGKMVIAITHDDRYYTEADKIIKMETGQIVETKYPKKLEFAGVK